MTINFRGFCVNRATCTLNQTGFSYTHTLEGTKYVWNAPELTNTYCVKFPLLLE
jgi:hypothetical protein